MITLGYKMNHQAMPFCNEKTFSCTVVASKIDMILSFLIFIGLMKWTSAGVNLLGTLGVRTYFMNV
jgi:hypothetical protein